jgi:hypothetical protein
LHVDGLPDFSAEGERDGFYQAQLICARISRMGCQIGDLVGGIG